MQQNSRVTGWMWCGALGATMLSASLLQAQRVEPQRFAGGTDRNSSPAFASHAAALQLTDPLAYRAPSKLPWVLGGAAAGAVVGVVAYHRALGPYGEDFIPYISIPYFVGGFGLLGAGIGWLIAPRR